MTRTGLTILLYAGIALLPGCMTTRCSPGSAARAALAVAPPAEPTPRQVVIIQPAPERPAAPSAALTSALHAPTPETTPAALSTARVPAQEADLGPSETLRPAAATVEPKPEESIRLLKALRAYLEEKPDEALELVKQYPPKDQDLLLTLLPIISQVEQKKSAWPDRLDGAQKLAVIQLLRSLLATLELSAPLMITKLDFAQEVKSFGRYTPVPKAQFRPGDLTTLYMEVENIRDRRAENGYVARLSGDLFIRGEHSNQGWFQPLRTAADKSSSERNDHFAVITFEVPKNAPPGMYVLFVQLVDQDTQRRTERGVTFRVVSRAASE